MDKIDPIEAPVGSYEWMVAIGNELKDAEVGFVGIEWLEGREVTSYPTLQFVVETQRIPARVRSAANYAGWTFTGADFANPQGTHGRPTINFVFYAAPYPEIREIRSVAAWFGLFNEVQDPCAEKCLAFSLQTQPPAAGSREWLKLLIATFWRDALGFELTDDRDGRFPVATGRKLTAVLPHTSSLPVVPVWCTGLTEYRGIHLGRRTAQGTLVWRIVFETFRDVNMNDFISLAEGAGLTDAPAPFVNAPQTLRYKPGFYDAG
jgi:hypothetical protein